MNYVDARQYALGFWAQPEFTPFPASVQDKLLASSQADLQRLGAMSVVHNGLLAADIEYIDAAEDILRGIPLDGAHTADAMAIARDICHLGLFRAMIDPQFKGNFGTQPKAALKTSLETRAKLSDKDNFHAGEATGAIAEALIVYLLNEAGFETIPSLPWQDQPFNLDKSARNPAFDAYVLTDGVAKHRVQVKSSLAKPPPNLGEEVKKTWGELDLETRREIMVASYAPEVAVLILETDLGIAREYQHSYFRSFAAKETTESRAWRLHAMDVVTEAVW